MDEWKLKEFASVLKQASDAIIQSTTHAAETVMPFQQDEQIWPDQCNVCIEYINQLIQAIRNLNKLVNSSKKPPKIIIDDSLYHQIEYVEEHLRKQILRNLKVFKRLSDIQMQNYGRTQSRRRIEETVDQQEKIVDNFDELAEPLADLMRKVQKLLQNMQNSQTSVNITCIEQFHKPR